MERTGICDGWQQ